MSPFRITKALLAFPAFALLGLVDLPTDDLPGCTSVTVEYDNQESGSWPKNTDFSVEFLVTNTGQDACTAYFRGDAWGYASTRSPSASPTSMDLEPNAGEYPRGLYRSASTAGSATIDLIVSDAPGGNDVGNDPTAITITN